MAAGGRCQLCNRELEEVWHADHIVPYCITGRTDVFEMQALCPQCNLMKGSSVASNCVADNYEVLMNYFNYAPSFRQQDGQLRAWMLAHEADHRADKTTWLFELVTGYGKTLTAYGCYWILSHRGIVSSMIVIVPTDEQRRQFAADVQIANELLGTKLQAWVITGDEKDIRARNTGRYDIFVGSYQHLSQDAAWYQSLMDDGSDWLVCLDECHHLSEAGRWAECESSLPNRKVRIGLTATPLRSDRARLFGMPEKATVTVTYKEAFDEEVVKKVVGYIDHYQLDVDIDGKPVLLTTEALKREGVVDFEKYEVKRQLRYNRSYLNRMLLEPVNDLAQRLQRHPGQHQMVVFCMSCKHADYVCGQLNSICQQLEYSYRAEWVGVGEGLDGTVKSAKENSQILDDFRNNKFHILVQVGKAEEGFSVKRISVLVFLHLIGADSKIIQQIGRGLRRNAYLLFCEDTVSIHASADTPIAEIVQRMECDSGGKRAKDPSRDDDDEREGDDIRLRGIPSLILVDSRYDKTDVVSPDGIPCLPVVGEEFCRKFNIPVSEYLKHIGSAALSVSRKQELPDTPEDRSANIGVQVKKATGALASNIVLLMSRNGKPTDNTTIGSAMRAINAEWKRTSGLSHSAMLPEEFRRKHAWLKAENETMTRTREIPAWARW